MAVAGVDLTVEQGEIFGFLGPNGADKTTTLRMLSTLLPPTAGEATVAGADLRREPAKVRQRIGYVSQVGSSFPDVAGRDELVLQGRQYDMSRGEAEKRAAELLKALELEDCGDRPTKTYFGGGSDAWTSGSGLCICLCCCFWTNPPPGLTHKAGRMWDEVRHLRDGGTTVFLTMHYHTILARKGYRHCKANGTMRRKPLIALRFVV